MKQEILLVTESNVYRSQLASCCLYVSIFTFRVVYLHYILGARLGAEFLGVPSSKALTSLKRSPMPGIHLGHFLVSCIT